MHRPCSLPLLTALALALLPATLPAGTGVGVFGLLEERPEILPEEDGAATPEEGCEGEELGPLRGGQDFVAEEALAGLAGQDPLGAHALAILRFRARTLLGEEDPGPYVRRAAAAVRAALAEDERPADPGRAILRRLAEEDVAQLALEGAGEGTGSLLVLSGQAVGCGGETGLRLWAVADASVGEVHELELDAAGVLTPGSSSLLYPGRRGEVRARLVAGRAHTLRPHLASWSLDAPVDEEGHEAMLEDPDHHPYLALRGDRAFRRGRHLGTEVVDGQLRLKAGVSEGVWASEVIRQPGGFDAAQFGYVTGGDERRGRVRLYARAVGPDGTRGRWRRVRRSQERRFPRRSNGIQFAAQFSRSRSAQDFGAALIAITVVLDLLFRIFQPNAVAGTGFLGQGGFNPGFRPPPTTGFGGNPVPGNGTKGGTPGSINAPGGVAGPAPSAGPLTDRPTARGGTLRLPSNLRFLARNQWDRDPLPTKGWANNPDGEYDEITIHHTAGPTTQTPKVIKDYHRNSKGWIDVAYHFLIGPDGTVYEGTPLGVRGTHSSPNTGRIGVCLIGHYSEADTDIESAALAPARDALLLLVDALQQSFPRTRGRVAPHGPQKYEDNGERKDCPGTSVERYFHGRGMWTHPEYPLTAQSSEWMRRSRLAYVATRF